MSVAEQPLTQTAATSPDSQLARTSWLGALYVLGSLALVLAALPWHWGELLRATAINEFLSSALLLLATLIVAGGLFFLGLRLEGSNPPHGLRAGIFVNCLTVAFLVWLLTALGNSRITTEFGPGTGMVITGLVGLGLVYVLFRVYSRPGFSRFLRALEDQGWFHAATYKPNQGLRVRRGTIVGLLALGICGIITMISHRALGSSHWELIIPFTDRYVPLLYQVHLTVPIILAIALVWTSWRVVNWPSFADFLIATEAEMHKVSWTTRKRLVQDTIVVLVTVFVLTAFLFVVDILWIKVLSWSPIRVLQVDIKAEIQKQQEKTQW